MRLEHLDHIRLRPQLLVLRRLVVAGHRGDPFLPLLLEVVVGVGVLLADLGWPTPKLLKAEFFVLAALALEL